MSGLPPLHDWVETPLGPAPPPPLPPVSPSSSAIDDIVSRFGTSRGAAEAAVAADQTTHREAMSYAQYRRQQLWDCIKNRNLRDLRAQLLREGLNGDSILWERSGIVVTPLVAAIQLGQPDALKVILETSSHIKHLPCSMPGLVKDTRIQAAPIFAVFSYNQGLSSKTRVELLECLLQSMQETKTPDAAYFDGDGLSLLCRAAADPAGLQLLDALLKRFHEDPNERCYFRQWNHVVTPMTFALHYEHVRTAQLLTVYGAFGFAPMIGYGVQQKALLDIVYAAEGVLRPSATQTQASPGNRITPHIAWLRLFYWLSQGKISHGSSTPLLSMDAPSFESLCGQLQDLLTAYEEEPRGFQRGLRAFQRRQKYLSEVLRPDEKEKLEATSMELLVYDATRQRWVMKSFGCVPDFDVPTTVALVASATFLVGAHGPKQTAPRFRQCFSRLLDVVVKYIPYATIPLMSMCIFGVYDYSKGWQRWNLDVECLRFPRGQVYPSLHFGAIDCLVRLQAVQQDDTDTLFSETLFQQACRGGLQGASAVYGLLRVYPALLRKSDILWPGLLQCWRSLFHASKTASPPQQQFITQVILCMGLGAFPRAATSMPSECEKGWLRFMEDLIPGVNVNTKNEPSLPAVMLCCLLQRFPIFAKTPLPDDPSQTLRDKVPGRSWVTGPSFFGEIVEAAEALQAGTMSRLPQTTVRLRSALQFMEETYLKMKTKYEATVSKWLALERH